MQNSIFSFTPFYSLIMAISNSIACIAQYGVPLCKGIPIATPQDLYFCNFQVSGLLQILSKSLQDHLCLQAKVVMQPFTSPFNGNFWAL